MAKRSSSAEKKEPSSRKISNIPIKKDLLKPTISPDKIIKTIFDNKNKHIVQRIDQTRPGLLTQFKKSLETYIQAQKNRTDLAHVLAQKKYFSKEAKAEAKKKELGPIDDQLKRDWLDIQNTIKDIDAIIPDEETRQLESVSTILADLKKKLDTHDIAPAEIEEMLLENKRIAQLYDEQTKQNLKESITTLIQGLDKKYYENLYKLKENINLKEDEKVIENENTVTNKYLRANAGLIQEQNTQSFASILIKALSEEQDGNFPEHTLTNLILACVWKKANTRDDIFTFLNALARSAGTTPQKLYTWRQTPAYTGNDYETIRDTAPKMIPDMNLEDLIFIRFGFDIFESNFPVKVGMTQTYYTTEDNNQIHFPDCGETSLRNLLNIVLYDSDHNFNLTLLGTLIGTETRSKQQDLLYQYYSEYYPTPTKIVEDMAHARWAQVVSNLSGVNYNNENVCDIRSGIKNMMAVINNLIPGANTIETLTKKLSDLGLDITMTPQYPPDQCDVGNAITITIKKEEITFTFTWHFKDGHFELDFPKSIMGHTQEFLKNMPTNNWASCMLMASFGQTQEELSKAVLDNNIVNSPKNSLYNCIMLRPLSSMASDNKLDLIMKILNISESTAATATKDNWHPLYDTAQAIAQTLDLTNMFFAGQFRLIIQILKIKEPLHENDKKIVQTLYKTAITAARKFDLTTINSAMHKGIINHILNVKEPTTQESIHLMEILYNIVAQILTKPDFIGKEDGIRAIAQKKIPEDEQSKRLVTILRDAALKAIGSLEKEKQDELNALFASQDR